MAYRKIIGFGDSSFVVSLPKEWVTKSGLKKGDLIEINEESEGLKLTSKDYKSSQNNKEITLNFQDLVSFKSQLICAYLSNYNVINIVGRNISNNLSKIREEIQNLVALEIIQQTSDKIMLKDFLNINDISVKDLVRRLDRIVLSMTEDAMIMLSKKENLLQSIEQKEIDINRIANLLFKVLKKCFNPNDQKILGLKIDEVFYYWELVLFLEKFADQVKRLPRPYINLEQNQDIVLLYSKLIEDYKTVMKAHFARDLELATEIIIKKGKVFEQCDEVENKLPRNYGPVIEKLRMMNTHIGNISKVYLKLHYGIDEDKQLKNAYVNLGKN